MGYTENKILNLCLWVGDEARGGPQSTSPFNSPILGQMFRRGRGLHI